MRHFVPALLAAASFCLTCCTLQEDDSGHAHRTKMGAFSDRYHPGRHGSYQGRGGFLSDTVVFITGVEFPDDYDWRRDSSYGAVPGRIVLMRNGERVVEIDAGAGAHASTAPDLHHLVEGHVYTEFTGGGKTFVGRDGTELFSYDGCETLRGLVTDGDDVYTLGQRKDGAGLALRRNGTVLFSRDGAFVAGHISDDYDYPTGALYMDSGHMYFCYWRPSEAGGSHKDWFIVEDGQETQIRTEGNGMFDIRVRGGEVTATPLSASQAIAVSLHDGESTARVMAYSDRKLLISNVSLGFYTFTKEEYYFFSFRNCDLAGTTLYLAITPVEEGKAPILWKNGAVSEIKINGFVTAVDVSVIPRQSP